MEIWKQGREKYGKTMKDEKFLSYFYKNYNINKRIMTRDKLNGLVSNQ